MLYYNSVIHRQPWGVEIRVIMGTTVLPSVPKKKVGKWRLCRREHFFLISEKVRNWQPNSVPGKILTKKIISQDIDISTYSGQRLFWGHFWDKSDNFGYLFCKEIHMVMWKVFFSLFAKTYLKTLLWAEDSDMSWECLFPENELWQNFKTWAEDSDMSLECLFPENELWQNFKTGYIITLFKIIKIVYMR
jgi:hypothetical protein